MLDAIDNRHFIYFDIETIPCQSEEYLEVLRKKVKAPASFKKEESIQKWLDENRDAAAREMLAKTSFDGGRGHVCTISWAKGDGEIKSLHAETTFEEEDIVKEFFSSLDPFHSEVLVGHYINGFDIRFLTQRAVCLGIPLPPSSSWPRDPKPWDATLSDTMVMWSGARGKISMDDLCEIFGFEGKGDFDGSRVAEAWANGEHEKIAAYCRDDVARTRMIHKKFLEVGF